MVTITIFDAVTPVRAAGGLRVVAMGSATCAVLNAVTPISPADAVGVRVLHREG